jgi:formate dehydrogenase beta subunit
MHCTEATCEKLCPAGARVRLDYGAVARNDEKCIGCQACVVACPFGKPRYSEEENKVYKCDLCPDRGQNNLSPACVKACPTGSLKFGKKEEMLRFAYERVKELGGEASVYGDKFFGGTHVVYILEKNVNFYEALPAKPKVASSVIFWKALLKPFGAIEAGVGLTGLAVSSFLTTRRQRIAGQHTKDKG